MCIIRSEILAKDSWWVTSMIVRFAWLCNLLKRFMTSSAFWLSRLPVGSSANKNLGSLSML